MPNAFLNPETILGVALERLRRQLVIPRLVNRMGVADFRGAKDDTVSVRVPAILTAREYEWRTRTAEIVLDELEELAVAVTLDRHIYSAVAVTDEELTLDIVDFTRQVLEPQIIAVAEKLESILAVIMADATYRETVTYTEAGDHTGAGFYNALVDARRILNAANVPLDGRAVLVGSNVEASALKEEGLRKADESGSTDALRRALIGQIAGFSVYTANGVDPDFAIAFHRSAFVFGNVAPAVPAGVSMGQSATEQDLALRWIRDYDARYLRDRSVVSSFAGGASVEDGRDTDSPGNPGDFDGTNIRAVKIEFTGAGS